MATIKTKSTYIERNNFDYCRAYAESQSSNPIIIEELIQSYVLIAQNLGITPSAFIQQMKEQSQPDIYLAAQLNSIRPRNSLLGVIPNNGTPIFIAREISA
jgi:hypothetical protein